MNSNQHLHGKDYSGNGHSRFCDAAIVFDRLPANATLFLRRTWDILCEFREAGWPTIWRMHNEHFMPISKALLYVQYELFGMFNLPSSCSTSACMQSTRLWCMCWQVSSPPSRFPACFGALVFSFSTVYWELTMWEAGQQTTFALLFVLLGLALAARFLTSGDLRLLAFTTLSALLASWRWDWGC